MRIVVTGAAGFIGSHLCERLLSAGHEVCGVDNLDDFYEPARKRKNLTYLNHPGFRFEELDIRDEDAVPAVFSGMDAIVHLAARARVRPSFSLPVLYSDVNVTGTAVLLELARSLHIPRFIFASSSSVYGGGAQVPFSENGDLGEPLSPYASTKLAGEMLCRNLSDQISHVAVLRLFTVYGPRQRPDLAIHKFARLITNGQPIPVYGPTDSYRDYTFVDDIVAGIVASLTLQEEWSVLNLASGSPITLEDMIRELESALGRPATRQPLPPQEGDLYGTWADITKAQSVLGYRPKWTFADGVQAFARWFKDEVSAASEG